MKKLTLSNYQKLIGYRFDEQNYVEDIVEHESTYSISVWREHRRKHVTLKRNPEDNGDYLIGLTEQSSMNEPYYIKLNEIKDPNVFLFALRKITNYWKIKHII